jgi:hypothetical protein
MPRSSTVRAVGGTSGGSVVEVVVVDGSVLGGTDGAADGALEVVVGAGAAVSGTGEGAVASVAVSTSSTTSEAGLAMVKAATAITMAAAPTRSEKTANARPRDVLLRCRALPLITTRTLAVVCCC